MRLDKFLKVSRIIKRRTLAKEVCDRQQVMVNGRIAKAGTVVETGDVIEISLGQRRVKVRIAEVRETIPASQAKDLYELIEDFRLKE
ncbi:Ribosomal 50S subunit-recycling heat shock protein, contains S4 domain [Desulfotomaculum arcticum]|uniref:RQC P-site tRNA stabilizing factor n=1 Tax=Desulfotruncus arcticus DSM 17038 TaxID=1121424 RepID=A0A1I2WER3_9FIRM|nr:RNA-binding S4 domain-containing protein [Desulfotruncus arcticus]SFG99803.1 Ribosomal 50S subunit-recycling heat shock protein, contains S4 domain [Desulfotomaculum arcticum] [Desulfotruncus arcticus DSM 17038]